jgi:hypothetical protein
MKNSKDQSLYKLLFLSSSSPADVLEIVPLSEINVEEVYELSRLFLEFHYGEFYGEDNNDEFPLIQTKEFPYIIPAIEHITTAMSVHPFLPLLYFEALNIRLYAWQILFDVRDSNIYPVKVRVNGQVRGNFTGNCSLSLNNEGFSIESFIPKNFELPHDEITPYHITVIYNLKNINEVFVYYNIIIQGIQINNTSKIAIIENFMTEKEFIEYCRKNNLPVSVRTLYMYRDISIFPEPLKVKGRNYYNPIWIKYIKFISDEKKKHGNPWIMKHLRANNKDFFRNIPWKKS